MQWTTTFIERLRTANALVSAIDFVDILDDARPVGKNVAGVGYDGVPFFRHGLELVYLVPSQVALCQDEFKDKGTPVNARTLGLRLHWGRDDDLEALYHYSLSQLLQHELWREMKPQVDTRNSFFSGTKTT